MARSELEALDDAMRWLVKPRLEDRPLYRRLKREGLVKYTRCPGNAPGFRGPGYGITEKGLAHLRELRQTCRSS